MDRYDQYSGQRNTYDKINIMISLSRIIFNDKKVACAGSCLTNILCQDSFSCCNLLSAVVDSLLHDDSKSEIFKITF